MILSEFGYVRPETIDRALTFLGENADARPLAGGQSVINVLKGRMTAVSHLVDISRLPDLRGIRINGDRLEIGAAVTYAEIAGSAVIQEWWPRLAMVASRTVDVQVRNRGTIGGNCCYADPASNFPPLLIALDAEMRLRSVTGERTVPAEQFAVTPFNPGLAPGELLIAVVLPPPAADTRLAYQSFSLMPDSWALARAVVRLDLDSEGIIERARVVLGGVEPVPRRLAEVEDALAGQSSAQIAAADLATRVGSLPDAIHDVHASAGYRRHLAKVLVARALVDAIEGST